MLHNFLLKEDYSIQIFTPLAPDAKFTTSFASWAYPVPITLGTVFIPITLITCFKISDVAVVNGTRATADLAFSNSTTPGAIVFSLTVMAYFHPTTSKT